MRVRPVFFVRMRFNRRILGRRKYGGIFLCLHGNVASCRDFGECLALCGNGCRAGKTTDYNTRGSYTDDVRIATFPNKLHAPVCILGRKLCGKRFEFRGFQGKFRLT